MSTVSFKPELLSPAGSLKNMRYAFAYGADAVYAGQPRYSLRVRNNEFDHDNLQTGISEAHALGKHFYVVANIQPHNAKLKTFIRDLSPVIEMQPDALIMSDPGLIMMVREAFPHMPIHLSVQANAVNWATVKFWHQLGLSRVILSRELSLEEIEEIRQQVPEVELEVFVHGALCMAYSGRCLLSGYMNKRDPNQGACTNACRWQYNVTPASEDDAGQLVAEAVQKSAHIAMINAETPAVALHQPTLGVGGYSTQAVLLEEPTKPGEYMAAYEDEHGTYIMNSKDLRAVQHVERLAKMGIHSLKIEGRTKSFYYCARTAQVYRKAIDDVMAGKPFNPDLMAQLENLAHRGYTEGFLRRHVHDEYQNYQTGNSVSDRQQFVGEVVARDGERVKFAVKNKFSVGDALELMTPQGNIAFKLSQLYDRKGSSTEVASGSGHEVWMDIPSDIDVQYGLLLRNLETNQTTRNPHAQSA